jgi:hypothetical protein
MRGGVCLRGTTIVVMPVHLKKLPQQHPGEPSVESRVARRNWHDQGAFSYDPFQALRDIAGFELVDDSSHLHLVIPDCAPSSCWIQDQSREVNRSGGLRGRDPPICGHLGFHQPKFLRRIITRCGISAHFLMP